MKVNLPYTCSCGASDVVQHEEVALKKDLALVGDCRTCRNTVVIGINDIDKQQKVINYTVQIRKTEKVNY